jgi:hypothetical protein
VQQEKEILESLDEKPLGRRARLPPGAYKKLNDGKNPLTANIATVEDTDEEVEPNQFTFDDNDELPDLPFDSFALHTSMGSEPKTLDEALASPNAKEWQAAYDYEINQLLKMGVFAAENLPEGETALPYTLVFREKLSADGNVESYRVRLVAGGHRQTEGINYDETFSSAAKSPTVRTVLGHAASEDWEIHQVDVKSAYLYAPLKEKVYMKAPPGILKPGEEGKVLRVLKCLYGLKQAGRGWYKEMSRVFIKELGFTRSAVDHSIFYRRSEEERTVVAVATDDMVLTSKRRIDIDKLKGEISQHWDISNKGELSWYLGFEVKRDWAVCTISINQ